MDDIYTRVPVNKTAAVVCGSGQHYTPNKKVLTGDSDLPIKTRKPKKCELGQPSFIDLAGYRQGRLTVIGLAKHHGGRWVARCDCGIYVLRRAKSLKNKSNSCDRCEHCRHLAFLKRRHEYKTTGVNRRDY